MNRIMIFIDGSNYYHSIKKSFNKTKVDLQKFINFIIKNKDLATIFYYTAPLNKNKFPEKYKKQQKFFSKIRQIKRLKLSLGRLEPRGNTMVEKGVDVKLAVDLVSKAYDNKYDIAVLVSNDADFVPAVEEVQVLTKKVYNVVFPKTKSFHLSKVCDKSIEINNISKFLI